VEREEGESKGGRRKRVKEGGRHGGRGGREGGWEREREREGGGR